MTQAVSRYNKASHRTFGLISGWLMSRFFSYDEIVSREPVPGEDVQWLAGEVMKLTPFVEGSAVLCGSVSWGKHSWRSDIDVAHFSTMQYPDVRPLIVELVGTYGEKTANRYITPRVDVITIGAESEGLVAQNDSASSPSVSTRGGLPSQVVSDLFVETAVPFADHLGSIAARKGGPWQAFVDRYLSSVDARSADRRAWIRSYVSNMTTEWEQQPLHDLNLGPDGQFTDLQLDLIAKTENYPINLMRRILGDLGEYPRPDGVGEVRDAFSALDHPWCKALITVVEPFFAVEEHYEGIVSACRRTGMPLSSADYHHQVRSLFAELPIARIQETVWEYTES